VYKNYKELNNKGLLRIENEDIQRLDQNGTDDMFAEFIYELNEYY